MTSAARPYFALVREDAAIEQSLVARFAPRRVVVVGSGGCTALSLLSDDVEQVLAVDISPAQTALVALRAAALGELDRQEYLGFVGAIPNDERLATWRRLRASVPTAPRAYWDAWPEAIAAGIDGCGVTESFYRYVGGSLRRSEWPDDVWTALLEAPSMSDQRALVARHFADARFRVALDVLLSRSTHELFYPASIFAHVAEHDFAWLFARRFREFAETQLLRRNYFLSQLLFGRYVLDADDGVPPYLTARGYSVARRNVGKLRIVTGSLEESLDASTEGDAFFLSNVLDWASEAQADRLGTVVRRAARPDATVLLRHMLGRPGVPASFGAEVDAEASAEATRVERSFLYSRVSIGRIGARS